VGVEPTDDTERCRPTVLKTVRITGPHALPHCKTRDLLPCGFYLPGFILVDGCEITTSKPLGPNSKV
jgi:hypothetical protein